MTSVALAVVVAAALSGPATTAKQFASVALVGVDGGSRERRLTAGEDERLFGGSEPAWPRGGYVRVYPLGRGGHVGSPGRFYPDTSALCFGWNQARRPRGCRRALVPLADEVLGLERFRGRGTTLDGLQSRNVRPSVLPNLDVAFELAFDRRRLHRPAERPRGCIWFRAFWRGPEARNRPTRFCLGPRGVHAGGLLYALGPDPYRLAALNPRY